MARPVLRNIRALVLDVDGVLTDGGMYYGSSGEPLKKFNVRDGMGLRLVREAGLVVAFISGDRSAAVQRRAEKLGIRDLFLGAEDKLDALERFLKSRRIASREAAYVGDDVNDLPPMRRVGLAIAVADAAPEVRKAAHWVTRRRGGDAAVREVCDILLKSRAPSDR
jgi:3-deoxy-D-manno-octulosonate 8-phosphate phosphatase (KDO 8-P phosphatase)